MTQVQFYHLLTTPLERALPKLMEKALGANMRCVIRVASDDAMQQMNELLWSYDPNSFLPHGNKFDVHPEKQPIYITTEDENPNSANVLVVTDGSSCELQDNVEKILDIFDGHNDDAVTAARTRWKHYKDAGAEVSYNKQQPGGSWKKAA